MLLCMKISALEMLPKKGETDVLVLDHVGTVTQQSKLDVLAHTCCNSCVSAAKKEKLMQDYA